MLTQSSKATYEGIANRLVIVYMIGPPVYECVCVCILTLIRHSYVIKLLLSFFRAHY